MTREQIADRKVASQLLRREARLGSMKASFNRSIKSRLVTTITTRIRTMNPNKAERTRLLIEANNRFTASELNGLFHDMAPPLAANPITIQDTNMRRKAEGKRRFI